MAYFLSTTSASITSPSVLPGAGDAPAASPAPAPCRRLPTTSPCPFSKIPSWRRNCWTPWATKSPRFEHRQIEAVIAALETDSARWLGRSTPQTDADVVSHLSAIRALVATHIEREERFLLPLLEDRAPTTG